MLKNVETYPIHGISSSNDSNVSTKTFDHTDKVNLPGFHHSSTIDEPKLVYLEPQGALRSGDLPWPYGGQISVQR